MKVQIYTCMALLPAIIGSMTFNSYSDNGNVKSGPSIQSDELIKKLPTALLDNLHRDLVEQEEKNNKNIDSIAGISRNKLEAEIMRRRSEDRSQTVGTRKIEPELLPGALLKYIAEHGISYEGCNPQDATNEMRNRTGISDDFPGVLATQIQTEHIKSQQKKAGEEFAEREAAEDLHDTVEEIKETAEQGKNPSLVKQAEYVKEREETRVDTANSVLKNVAEGENIAPPPHGYDAKVQNERSSEEIKDVEKAVEERNLVTPKAEKGFFSEIWNGIKQRFNNWFNDGASNSDSASTRGITDGVNEMR